MLIRPTILAGTEYSDWMSIIEFGADFIIDAFGGDDAIETAFNWNIGDIFAGAGNDSVTSYADSDITMYLGDGDDFASAHQTSWVSIDGSAGDDYVSVGDAYMAYVDLGAGNNSGNIDNTSYAYLVGGEGHNSINGWNNGNFNAVGGGGGGSFSTGYNQSAHVTTYDGTNEAWSYYDQYYSFYGGNGVDTVHITGAEGQFDSVLTGAGDDTVIVDGDPDTFVDLGDGNDIGIGGWGLDVMFGGDGSDYLYGRDGNDVLVGGNGNDVIDAGIGLNVYVDGGNGSDLLLVMQGHTVNVGNDYDADVVGIRSDVREGTLHVEGFQPQDMVDARNVPGIEHIDVWDLPNSPSGEAAGVFIQGLGLRIEGNLTAADVATPDYHPANHVQENHDLLMA